MTKNYPDSFPPEVVEKLKVYVYRLIDPRNGETFYVGKGKANRVFSHAKGKLKDDDINDKLRRIREIKLAGFHVAHVIHRHGMTDDTAEEVEAALIDTYPGITNIYGGVGSNDRGSMHSKEIIDLYCAEPAVINHKVLFINVNRSAAEISLYEATRYAWRIDKSKAEQAEVILPIRNGIIRGAFIADRWIEATKDNFPGREDAPGRFGFYGRDASPDVIELYVGKRIPDEYRKRGAANPIKYSW